MYKVHITTAILYLAVIANCGAQESEIENMTSMENTAGANQIVDKRQILAAAAVTGLLENMLSTNGLNTESVESLINLFNPEKLQNDFLVMRRIFTLFARFGIVLNSYLPTPSSTGNRVTPLDILSSKIRLYTPTSAENLEWVPIIKNETSHSPQVQTIINSLNQKDMDSNATETVEVSSEQETNQNLYMDVQTSTEQKTVMPEIEMETSISTNSNQNYPGQDANVNTLILTEENTIDETISLQNKFSNVNQKPKKDSPSNNLILRKNQKGQEKLATKLRPNSPISNVNKVQQPRKPALKYGVPSNENKQENVSTEESGQTDDLLSEGTENKVRRNEISEENGLPLTKKSDSHSEKSYVSATVPVHIPHFDNYDSSSPNKDNLINRTDELEDGVPAQNTNTNNSGRRREKSGVPSVRSSHSKKASHNEKRVETNKLLPYIAVVPVQRRRIFDRVHGPLYDSFGVPVIV